MYAYYHFNNNILFKEKILEDALHVYKTSFSIKFIFVFNS